MRFLLDQDVYGTTARLLDSFGHDVVRVAQIGLAQAEDEELLRVAREPVSYTHLTLPTNREV